MDHFISDLFCLAITLFVAHCLREAPAHPAPVLAPAPPVPPAPPVAPAPPAPTTVAELRSAARARLGPSARIGGRRIAQARRADLLAALADADR